MGELRPRRAVCQRTCAHFISTEDNQLREAMVAAVRARVTDVTNSGGPVSNFCAATQPLAMEQIGREEEARKSNARGQASQRAVDMTDAAYTPHTHKDAAAITSQTDAYRKGFILEQTSQSRRESEQEAAEILRNGFNIDNHRA